MFWLGGVSLGVWCLAMRTQTPIRKIFQRYHKLPAFVSSVRTAKTADGRVHKEDSTRVPDL